jgi:hypothetical protein
MAASVSTAGFSASAVGFLPVLASLRVRDLLIASWEIERDAVERVLPASLEPADVDGRFLVSLAAFRVVGGRLGRIPVPAHAQLNARTYATWERRPAVFFLDARVSPAGLPARLVGAPVRQARLRLRPGSASAPGLGVQLDYSVGDEADVGFGRHEVGVFELGGLRALEIRFGTAAWRHADLRSPARADLLLALGFDLRADPSLVYAERASFEVEVPPRRRRRRDSGKDAYD